MRTVAIILGAWVVVSVLLGTAVGALLARLRRSGRELEGLSDLAIASRLRPRGHVEAAPVEPPIGPEIIVNGETVGYGDEGMRAALYRMMDAPAPIQTNGRRV